MWFNLLGIYRHLKPKRKRDIESSASDSVPAPSVEPTEELLKEYVGTGRITSSGTTIHGHYTEFTTQLVPGDAIIITHPIT